MNEFMQKKDIDLFLADLMDLSDRQIQEKYLNSCQYKDLVTSALSQLKDDREVLRIIRLALEVDLFLGATLIKGIKTELQAEVINWVINLEISEKVRIELLKITKSELAIAFCQDRLFNYVDRNQDNLYHLEIISGIVNTIKNTKLKSLSAILIKVLDHPHNNIKRLALEALKGWQIELDNIDEIKILLKKLITNQACELRSLALERLVELGDESIINLLINDYQSEYYLKRWKIVNILGKAQNLSILKYLIYGLYDEDRSILFQSAQALGSIGGDLAFDVLFHGLCQKIEDEESRCVLNISIGEALKKINTNKAIEKLSLMLQSGDAYIRKNAVEVLRNFSSQSALPIIKTALDDKDNEVVLEALRSLFYYYQFCTVTNKEKISIECLSHCLQSNNSEVFRWTLDIIENKESIYPLLLERLNDENLEIRRETIYNLVLTGKIEVKPELLKLIEDNEPQIQAYAANALGKIGNKSDIPVLIKKLRHSEAIVREGAANGLRLIGSNLGKQALIEALQDENANVKESVILALAAIGGEDAEECLINSMLDSPDFILDPRTINVLGIIGGEKTVKILRQALINSNKIVDKQYNGILADEEIVIQALERIGSTSAIEAILATLPHNNYIDGFAINALSNIGTLDTIPHLYSIQEKSQHTRFYQAIANIQKRYQYYNSMYCNETPQIIDEKIVNQYKRSYLFRYERLINQYYL